MAERRLDVERVQQVGEAAAGDRIASLARRERRVDQVARDADHADLAGVDVDLDQEHDVHPPAPAIRTGVRTEQQQVELAVVAPGHRARALPWDRDTEGGQAAVPGRARRARRVRGVRRSGRRFIRRQGRRRRVGCVVLVVGREGPVRRHRLFGGRLGLGRRIAAGEHRVEEVVRGGDGRADPDVRGDDEEQDRGTEDRDREPGSFRRPRSVDAGRDPPRGQRDVDDGERRQDARGDREREHRRQPAAGVVAEDRRGEEHDRNEEQQHRPPPPDEGMPGTGDQQAEECGHGGAPRGWARGWLVRAQRGHTMQRGCKHGGGTEVTVPYRKEHSGGVRWGPVGSCVVRGTRASGAPRPVGAP